MTDFSKVLLAGIAGFFAVAFAALLCAIRRAEEGYEDLAGYHPGELDEALAKGDAGILGSV